MINAVIIEDESIYMDDLTEKLNGLETEINIVSKITSGTEALKIVPKINFDLLFLDIELGDMTAFDFLERLKTHDFHIIFVTAFEQYAIKAFKVNAIDYLLKPVKEKELVFAVEKAMQQVFSYDRKQNLMVDYHLSVSNTLCVSDSNYYTYIPCKDILYCESDGNYTKIFYEEDGNNNKMVATKNLLYFEKKLKAFNFIRIHQSVLVNSKLIKKIKYNSHTGTIVV